MAGVVAAAADTACLTRSSISASSSKAVASSRGIDNPSLGIRRLNLHGGLKAQNSLMAMGSSVSAEQQFANMRACCRAVGGASRGGALASKCDAGSVILTTIPIMCGMTLLGVALGFVLLRVEAFVEEGDE